MFNIMALFRALPGSIAQGLIWGIMAVGVYITYKVLDYADLTVDGSIATGGAVAVMMMLSGQNVYVALLCATLAGMAAGLVTGIFHAAFGIPAILSGILSQLGLYSINMRIMGKSNQAISVDQYDLILSLREIPKAVLVSVVFCVVVVAVLYWFFGTELGRAIRATGNNENMSRAQGINTKTMKVIGLMISNGLVGLAGGLYAQYQGNADVNMGRGAIVIGLAAVIIGGVLFGKVFNNFALRMVGVIIGAILYFVVIAVVLWLGLETTDMKLISALIVAVFLAVPHLKGQYDIGHVRKGEKGMLELKNVCKTFNPNTPNEKRALTNLNLTLEDGDFVTVIGGNGAGKSTMLNAIAGVWPIDSGSVLIDGEDVTRLPEHKRAAYLGRVFQDPMNGTAADMEIEENLALALRRGQSRGLAWGIRAQEREEYRELLKPLDLGLETRLRAKVGLLSGGQRQALTLLMATLKKPKLLLLDEHTAALDPKTAAKVLELSDKVVKENELTALMVTHNMKDAIAHGNRLIMMCDGRVILDIRGEEKARLTVDDLLQQFSVASGSEFANDRALLG